MSSASATSGRPRSLPSAADIPARRAATTWRGRGLPGSRQCRLHEPGREDVERRDGQAGPASPSAAARAGEVGQPGCSPGRRTRRRPRGRSSRRRAGPPGRTRPCATGAAGPRACLDHRGRPRTGPGARVTAGCGQVVDGTRAGRHSMRSTMQEFPLTIGAILRHGTEVHGDGRGGDGDGGRSRAKPTTTSAARRPAGQRPAGTGDHRRPAGRHVPVEQRRAPRGLPRRPLDGRGAAHR